MEAFLRLLGKAWHDDKKDQCKLMYKKTQIDEYDDDGQFILEDKCLLIYFQEKKKIFVV